MIHKQHSNTLYLSEDQAQSRHAGASYFHLCNIDADSTIKEENNGALLVTSTIMRNEMSSTAEAECESLFDTCKEGVPIRITIVEMDHPHPATPAQVDLRICQQPPQITTIQIHGHTIILDIRLRQTRPIPHLLRIRPRK